MIVEASCGQCQFGMKGYACDLAVRIDGKSYFVDGTSIDSVMHIQMTVFAAIRKAEVSGTIEPFVATSFKLLLKKRK
jgi:hypothetical protein